LAPAAVLLVLGLSGRFVAAVVIPPNGPNAGWDADWHSVIVRSFWCQADLFAFGMALAVVLVDWEDGRLRLPRRWRMFAAIAALVGYGVTASRTVPGDQLSHSPYNTLMALSCSLVLAAVVLSPRRDETPSPLARLLDHPRLISGGVISYSVFLWHEPLVRWFRDHGVTRAGPGGLLLNLTVVGLAALLLSVFSYRFIEAPALRSRERRRAL
jgi:peptidoglycan/LPS O-acetylase OafA/YrhL